MMRSLVLASFALSVLLGDLSPARATDEGSAASAPPDEATLQATGSTEAPAPSLLPTASSVPPVAVPAAVPAATPVPSASPSFKTELPGGSSLRVGILLQPQFQSASDYERDRYANNLFIRRTRILVGGTLFGVIEYFMETDFANIFMANNVAGANGAPDTAVKATPGMNIQDAFVTWKAYKDFLKFDVGYTIPPLAHNAVQSAASLYSWDYLSYSFQHNSAFLSSANPVGRDMGIAARGLLFAGHIEYRAGLYQGLRKGQTETEVGSRNFFRFAGRLQINILDAETGYFYAGSYLGAKRILSLGGAVDIQESYKYFAGDAFLDLPIGSVGIITAQVNLAHWNGGDFIPALVKQTALMGEAGFHWSVFHVGPIVRAEHLWGSDRLADQTRISGGIAYWAFGHNCNVKAFYSRIKQDGASKDINQFNVQWQVFVY